MAFECLGDPARGRSSIRVVRLAAHAGPPPPPFRTGEAGWLRFTEDGEAQVEARLHLSANSTHALLGHGVVGQLRELAPELGALGSGQDVLFPPASLDRASEILYEADRRTYGAIWEFVVEEHLEPERVRYVVRVDNREYQRSLARLQDLLRAASRGGLGAWLRI